MNKRQPHLDAIRGIAALLVLIEHTRAALFIPYGSLESSSLPLALFYAATSMGFEAVMIFFALSGYLVGGQAFGRIAAANFDAALYGTRRLTRLFIVIVPALALTAIFDAVGMNFGTDFAYDGALGNIVPSLPRDQPASYSVSTFLGNLAFLQTIVVPTFGSNGPMWSLAYEFWYYVLGPLIAFVALSRKSMLARVGCAFAAVTISILLPPIVVQLGIIWLAGALAGHLSHSDSMSRALRFGIIRIALLAPAFIALALTRVPSVHVPNVLLGLLVAVALPAATAVPSFGRFYERTAYTLAEVSYTLYLVHFPFVVAIASIFVLPDRMLPGYEAFTTFLGVVTLAMVYSALVYSVFERRTDAVYRAVIGNFRRFGVLLQSDPKAHPTCNPMTSNPNSLTPVRLETFDNSEFDRGRSPFIEALWIAASAIVMRSNLPASALRKMLLKAFGAKIGAGVVIKPNVNIKFPWRLTIGDQSWVGEGVWIDNLAEITVGADVCLSQGAYLCTGSHDWTKPSFDLVTRSIVIGDGAWVCAKTIIGPGVKIEAGAVVGLGAVATRDIPEMTILRADGTLVERRRSAVSHSGTTNLR